MAAWPLRAGWPSTEIVPWESGISQDGLEQGGLARPIGAENGEELPWLDGQPHLLPDGAPAQGDGCVLHLDDRRKGCNIMHERTNW